MNEFKFLHCADLHLGCTPFHLEKRYDDFFSSFNSLINDAISKKCKYILISGDLFHLKVINSKTLLKVIELLEKAKNANIKVFVIEGNHDKAFYVDEDSWLNFLYKKGYIILLSHKIVDGKVVVDKDSIYEDDDVRIIGIGYLGSLTSEYINNINLNIKKSKKFTILMLHAAINRLCGEDMGDINIDILNPLKKYIDYVALGHIHTRYEYDNWCYNPGSLENIRIKDGKKAEKKGYYIVNVIENNKEVEYIESIKRKTNYVSFQFNNNQFIDEITEYIKNFEFDVKDEEILELTIYGNVSFNPYLINFDEIKNHIYKKYNLLYIEINNYINIIRAEKELTNVLDIQSIETEAIKNYLDVNFPQLSNKELVINDFHNLKQAFINGEEIDIIIKNMLPGGDE